MQELILAAQFDRSALSQVPVGLLAQRLFQSNFKDGSVNKPLRRNHSVKPLATETSRKPPVKETSRKRPVTIRSDRATELCHSGRTTAGRVKLPL